MREPDNRTCKCSHKAYDHLGAGRCDVGSKRCGCPQFRECPHAETEPWVTSSGTGKVCTTCNYVVEYPRKSVS